MPKKDKKILIFEAAIKCIGKYGVEKTNAQTIADELDVAQSGIFYYFPKQEMIFDSLMGYIAEVNHDMVSKLQKRRKPKTAYESLLTHIEGNLLWAKRKPDQVCVLFLSVAKTAHSKFMKDLMNHITAVGEERIYHYLTSGVAEREFRVQGDIRETAVFIHKSLVGITIANYYARSEGRTDTYFFNLFKEKLKCFIIAVPPTTKRTTRFPKGGYLSELEKRE